MLPDDLIRALHTAAVHAQLDRRALLAGIDPALTAGFPQASTSTAQILTDLYTLKSLGKLLDGSTPLLTYLENGVQLLGPRPEAQAFRDALHALGVSTPTPTPARAPAPALTAIDVLILTAIKEEYAAVLQVDTGASPQSAWVEHPGPTGLPIASRTFLSTSSRPLRIAVARSPEMGGVATANTAVPILEAYRPRCLAMCGVCAGRRGAVNLGDVIVADRLYTYDTGKLVVEIDDAGQRTERIQGDILTYSIDPVWKQHAESFTPDEAEPWIATRPRPRLLQAEWILERLHHGDTNPAAHPDRKRKCPDYAPALELLWSKAWLDDGALTLTPEGKKHIQRRLTLHPDGLPEPAPFAVHVGPIATGSKLVQDPQIFERLSVSMRKVIGLEMEASAIGAVAHLQKVQHMIVMKGVMDHADHDKADHFKAFAARASAECLIAFLRANLAPPGSLA